MIGFLFLVREDGSWCACECDKLSFNFDGPAVALTGLVLVLVSVVLPLNVMRILLAAGSLLMDRGVEFRLVGGELAREVVKT